MSSSESASEIRKRITPEAFGVEPSLLDTPLAAPGKRLVAILLDLVFIGIFSLMGFTFFCLLAALMFLREAIKANRRPLDQREDIIRHKSNWMGAFSVAFFVLFFLSYTTGHFVDSSSNHNAENLDQITVIDKGDASKLLLSRIDDLESENTETSTAAATAIIQAITKDGDLSYSDINETIDITPCILGLTEKGKNKLRDANKQYFNELKKQKRKSLLEDSSAQTAYDYWEAVNQKKNTEEIAQKRNSLKKEIAGKEINDLGNKNKELRKELIEKNSFSTGHIISYIKNVAEDLGVKFGWLMFYFMTFPAFFRGRTIGKHLMGLQIIRLDGKALSLWNTFERTGAYYAGLATGLLGFAQILWDPNRQAIQDKIAGTVVIRAKVALKPIKQKERTEEEIQPEEDKENASEE